MLTAFILMIYDRSKCIFRVDEESKKIDTGSKQTGVSL